MSEPQTATHRAARLIFGVGTGIASTVYGTITVMATIAVYGIETHPWQLAVAVAGTALVLWVAHLYAHALSESIHLHEPLRPAALWRIARGELGIVLAAVLPLTALLLGAAGVLREHVAVWTAICVGLATLGVEGARYARLEDLRLGGTTLAIAINVGLGLLVVLLKVDLHH